MPPVVKVKVHSLASRQEEGVAAVATGAKIERLSWRASENLTSEIGSQQLSHSDSSHFKKRPPFTFIPVDKRGEGILGPRGHLQFGCACRARGPSIRRQTPRYDGRSRSNLLKTLMHHVIPCPNNRAQIRSSPCQVTR